MTRPLIGLTTTILTSDSGLDSAGIRTTYVQAVLDAGGAPVLVPPAPEDVLRDIFARLDGLLLPGGGDIDPQRYGEAALAQCGTPEQRRDDLEMALCRWALADGKPLLAICRGIQVMNVAAGGALYQDIPTQYPTRLRHSTPGSARAFIAHAVQPAAGSLFATVVGGEELPVNSWHHQALKTLGAGLVVSATAPDGIVEALEAPAHRFALGVQFHPEDLYPTDERSKGLFMRFVAACR